MSIFDFSRKKKTEASVEEKVCIPEHQRIREEAERKAALDPRILAKQEFQRKKELKETLRDMPIKEAIKDPAFRQRGMFEVSGVYCVGKTLMVSGFVESGVIKNRMKTFKGGNEMRVEEIRIGSEKVANLKAGEEGTLFVKTKNVPNIKYSEILLFEAK